VVRDRNRPPPQLEPRYDGDDDFAKSLLVAYAAIRERMAKGGPGWTPGEGEPGRKEGERSSQARGPVATPSHCSTIIFKTDSEKSPVRDR
jgi:hypothetical protein